MKNDIYSNINTVSTYIASTITVYFVLSDSINNIASTNKASNLYVDASLFIFSLSIAYGPAYLSSKVNLSSQKDNALDLQKGWGVEVASDFLYQDGSFYNTNENVKQNMESELSNHDKIVLSLIFLINVCYSVFPCLFLFSVFTKQNELKEMKAGIICASAFFGCINAVAPIRNTKKFLIENKG